MMTVRVKDIAVGRCYVTGSDTVRIVLEITADRHVRWKGFKVESDPASGKKIITPNVAVQSEARKLKAQGYSARLAAGHLVALGHKATHKSVLTLWSALGA